MSRSHGRRALQGRRGRGSARAITSAALDHEPESSELSSDPTSSVEEGAEAAPPQPGTPQTSLAGGHGNRGWSTYRFASSTPLDISKAKMELAFLEPTDGQPVWSFICEKWPYGYPDRAISDIFQRALTINVQRNTSKAGGKMKKGNYCSIEATLRRLGFRFKDLEHVKLTFKVAFLVMLAVELRRSGFGTISRNYKCTSVSQAWIHDVLKTNPVIRAWLEPPARFFNDLYEVTSHGVAEGISDVAVEFAKQLFPDAQDISTKTAKSLYLRQIAKERHTALVEIAIDAVMQQFWKKAGSTWLSRSKQSNATTKSQWEDLRTRCVKEHHLLMDRNDTQHEEAFWLPRYEVGMASAPESLVDAGKEYGATLNEFRIKLQEAAEAEKARKAALEAEAKRRKQAKTSRGGQGQGSSETQTSQDNRA